MDVLLATIKANKDVLSEKEKRVVGFQADIKAVENELNRVEMEIKEMKAHGSVDKTTFNKRVAKYNTLLQYDNDQAAKLKDEVSAYQTLLMETNRMVNEYNGRIKAR